MIPGLGSRARSLYPDRCFACRANRRQAQGIRFEVSLVADDQLRQLCRLSGGGAKHHFELLKVSCSFGVISVVFILVSILYYIYLSIYLSIIIYICVGVGCIYICVCLLLFIAIIVIIKEICDTYI